MIRGIVISVWEGFIKLFSATGRTSESFTDREYFQHYGYTSRPLPGAEIIIIREGNHILGIGSDDRRYRLAIEEGEVALYTDEGDKIHLKRNRTIEIVSEKILLGSQGTPRFLVDERFLDIYNNHMHGADGKPVTKLTDATVCTSITKGA